MSSLFERSTAYKPFKYPWAVEAAIDHDKQAWGEWEGQLQDDINQWKSGEITPAEKEHITQILRLFTQTDVEVACNYSDVFIPMFKNNEIRMMLRSFVQREDVHTRAYALLNDTLGLDESEYSAFLDYKEMADKVEFMQAKNMEDKCVYEYGKDKQIIGYQLAQTVCNEGMSLFSAFAMLLNYQLRGKMKGMCEIVEWSLVDETMHIDGMVRLFRTLCEEHQEILTDKFKKEIYNLYRDAVELEDKVIDLSYAMGPVEGLNKEEVKTYIRYLADRRLIQLGLRPNYGVDKNPLPWLEWITSATSFKNFFEGRVTDYSQDGMEGNMFENPYIPPKSNVKIYSLPNCPACVKAKQLLQINNIVFEEFSFTEHMEEFQELYNTQVRSAPQIVVNDKVIGGYDDLINQFSFHRKVA